jgi:nicotinamidase-related amidase
LTAPAKNRDLHGSVPDRSDVVLILTDLINDFEFDGAGPLLRNALGIAPRIAALKKRAKRNAVPIIYVNDNFGKWRSDFKGLVDHCLQNGRGRRLARMLRPDDDDYCVLKPKHSAFFSTTLDALLRYLGAKTVVLAGISANSCVLFTANDAHMRDLHLVIPRDCIAAASREDSRYALQHFSTMLHADTRLSSRLRFSARKAELEGKSHS